MADMFEVDAALSHITWSCLGNVCIYMFVPNASNGPIDADLHDLMSVKISGPAIMKDFNPIVNRWWLCGEKARRSDTLQYGQRQ